MLAILSMAFFPMFWSLAFQVSLAVRDHEAALRPAGRQTATLAQGGRIAY
jgi:hypothetical protein